jgi:hypothetical protein
MGSKAWPLLLALIAAAFGFSLCLDQGLNHDEHQFAAPAILFAREGLVPYRDFPLFHLPYTLYTYAAVSVFSEHNFLWMRWLCGGSCALTLCLIAAVAARAPRGSDPLPRLAGLALATGLLLTSPSLLSSSGLTWNHDLPILLTVAGAVALIGPVESAGRGRARLLWALAAGVCGGVATGMRLTFLPVALGMVAVPWLFSKRPMRERWLAVGAVATGLVVALLPVGWAAMQAPEAFMFGNFQSNRVAALDPANERVEKTLTWWRKLRYFLKEIVKGNGFLFGSWLIAAVPAWWAWGRRREEASAGSAAVGWLYLAALAGCFMPSRYQFQHFLVLAPLAALGLACALRRPWPRWRWVLIGGAWAVSWIGGQWIGRNDRRTAIESYAVSLEKALHPEAWVPMEWSRAGEEVVRRAGRGRVLTLAPMPVVEAGGTIYPELVLGPFGWRNAHLLEASRRRALHLLAPEDLEARLAGDRPSAVWLGFEPEALEGPLRAYARRNGMVKVDPWEGRGELWVWP